MERLTERTTYGIVGNNEKVKNYPLYKVAKDDPLDYGITGQCFDKLADYEDLEEQCIAENQCGLRELLLKWKEFFGDIAKLYDYRKAEKQGLLHKFSCRVGDIIYFVTSRDILRKVVINIKIDEDGIEYYASGIVFREENIGECIFLSEAEAESALEEKGE